MGSQLAMLRYESPTISHWTARSLESITATMSGGTAINPNDSKVASAPAPYQWFEGGTAASSTYVNIDKVNAVIDTVQSVLVASVYPTLVKAKLHVANSVFDLAQEIATDLIKANVENVFWKSTLYELSRDMSYETDLGENWHPVGNAYYVRIYTDSSYSEVVETSLTSDLDGDLIFLANYLCSYLSL